MMIGEDWKMKCLVKGCVNHDHEGGFNGLLCSPCYTMITTGDVAYGHTFIHDLRDELLLAAVMAERANDGLYPKHDA